jgi:hypothetical protein
VCDAILSHYQQSLGRAVEKLLSYTALRDRFHLFVILTGFKLLRF